MAPDKSLALAVTKTMLYGEKPPLVGVSLVYKPHYISTVPFSAAYMQLNVWHSAGPDEESEDRLSASRLLFVNISEMSDVIPVAVQHPILLNVASREAYVSPLLKRLQTQYHLDPATWRGVGSSYHFPSFPRREQLISAQI